MTRTVLHFAQDSDTSGFFPQLAVWHDRQRFRMLFGTLRPLDPRLRKHMEESGVSCLDCGCRSRWTYPWGLIKLTAFLIRHRIEILHSHLFDPSIVGLAAGFLARTPGRVLTRHHSDYHTRIDRPVHVWLDRFCTLLSHRVIAVSRHTADHLLAVEKAPPTKVRVVHNGIDFARVRISSAEAPARIRAELGLTGRKVVLMPARLHPEKGYEVLFNALPNVAAQVGNVALLIAGTGPLEAHYRALSASLGLDGRVQFLGFRRDLPDLMVASDVVVLPSLAEAFGLAAAESIYLGVPVVTSNAGGLAEIVEGGVDGLLVPPGDADSLARALVQVLGDDELRRRFAGAGRERIASSFSFEKMVRAYERVYDELGPT